MSEIHLHIISFDIPYPANYGGVIDVFYKIQSLHQAGIKIHLHCFEYHRQPAPELEKLCFQVHYYPRATGIRALFGRRPYIVSGRRSEELIENLLTDDYPILFEGLHSCYHLDDQRLEKRFKIYRESNIEHHYYRHLFRSEKSLWKKAFFLSESIRLRHFQKTIRFSSLMLTVSREDTAYLKGHFPTHRVEFLPSFHREEQVDGLTGKGSFILYQGNLSVAENLVAAEFLIREVMDETLPELIIAGMAPPRSLFRMAASKTNIRIVADPTDEEMFQLIRNAQINVLVTFQPTGLKLKLLNALLNGRFCIVNPPMLAGTDLEKICEVAVDAINLKQKIEELYQLEFTREMLAERKEVLSESYSNQKNCKKLLELLPLC